MGAGAPVGAGGVPAGTTFFDPIAGPHKQQAHNPVRRTGG